MINQNGLDNITKGDKKNSKLAFFIYLKLLY